MVSSKNLLNLILCVFSVVVVHRGVSRGTTTGATREAMKEVMTATMTAMKTESTDHTGELFFRCPCISLLP